MDSATLEGSVALSSFPGFFSMRKSLPVVGGLLQTTGNILRDQQLLIKTHMRSYENTMGNYEQEI